MSIKLIQPKVVIREPNSDCLDFLKLREAGFMVGKKERATQIWLTSMKIVEYLFDCEQNWCIYYNIMVCWDFC